MYPAAARELPAHDVVDGEVEAEGPRSSAAVRHRQPRTAASKPADGSAAVEGAVKIAKAEVKEGETKGRKWTRYTIVDSNGVSVSTFDKQHYDDAKRFQAENAWVEIVTERDGEYVNVVEIIKAGSEPKLPGLDEV
jgi:hypothetical protein